MEDRHAHFAVPVDWGVDCRAAMLNVQIGLLCRANALRKSDASAGALAT